MSRSGEMEDICRIIGSFGAFEECEGGDHEPLGLDRSEAQQAIAQLRMLCSAGDPHVRMAAGVALSRATSDQSMELAVLISSLQESDEIVRAVAMLAIGQLGRAALDAVPLLIEALRCEGTRIDASSSLCAIGPAVTPLLISALRTPDHEIFEAIIRILCSIEPIEDSCVQALTACLTHTDALRRRICIAMVNAHGLYNCLDVHSIAKLLEEDDCLIRNEAVTFLRKAPGGFERKGPYLIQCLGDIDPNIRANAVTSIGEHGSEARTALPEVVELLEDSVPTVARAATKALDRILVELAN